MLPSTDCCLILISVSQVLTCPDCGPGPSCAFNESQVEEKKNIRLGYYSDIDNIVDRTAKGVGSEMLRFHGLMAASCQRHRARLRKRLQNQHQA